jgi:YkoY family integral membrane protein
MPSGLMSELLLHWPLILGTVVMLVFVEGLLSADNALVLAMMVRHLPRDEQKRALRYGIWGAFGFRLIAVCLSAALLKFWYFEVIGGLYLIYLAAAHFLSREGESGKSGAKRFGSGFWGTVLSVELADIAFSIDSIVAAVAMAPTSLHDYTRLGIVFTGGILGIITMRYVAGYFIVLLDRFEGLAAGAYFLVAWIGLKLVISGVESAEYIHREMPEWLFWTGMAVIIVVSMLLPSKKTKHDGFDGVAATVRPQTEKVADR